MSRLSKPAAAKPTAKEIEQFAALAQTAFYTLLPVLAFVAVAILSTTDMDFLVGSKSTQIPIVNVSVPTERFFFLAPIVTTILYGQLHLLCMKLWNAVRSADPAEMKAAQLNSFVGDVALYFRPGMRPRGGDHWADIGTIVAAMLIWVAHPVILVWALVRSSAATLNFWAPDQFPSLSIASPWAVQGAIVLCLSISAAIGTASLLTALSVRRPDLAARRLPSLASVVVLVAVLVAGNLRVASESDPIDVDRQNLAGLDDDWPRVKERLAIFRSEWCGARKLDEKLCGMTPGISRKKAAKVAERRRRFCESQRPELSCDEYFGELDTDFVADWTMLRSAELARLPELDLDDRNLTGASAEGAKLVSAHMQGAILNRATLKHADFEGAKLRDAHLDEARAYSAVFDHADLTGAFVRLANLESASFEYASLVGTYLAGASLVNASLAGAKLPKADLAAVNLTGARLGWADLTGVELDGAVLDKADLSGAIGLTQDQLDGAVGNLDTRLPLPATGQQRLYVVSCWTSIPEAATAAIEDLPDGERKEEVNDWLEGRPRCTEANPQRRFYGQPPTALAEAANHRAGDDDRTAHRRHRRQVDSEPIAEVALE